MAGSLKVGSVYVAVSANIDGLTKGLSKAIKKVGDVAKKFQAFGSQLQAIGTIATAALTASLVAARNWSGSLGTALDKVKNTFLTFSASIGEALVPFIDHISDLLQRLLGYWQSLSPALRRHIADALALSAVLAVVGGGLGKVAGLIGAFADIMVTALIPAGTAVIAGLASLGTSILGLIPGIEAVGSALSAALLPALGETGVAFLAIAAPILAVVAVLGALALAVGAAYKYWETHTTQIKATLASAWASVKSGLASFGEFFVNLWDKLLGFLGTAVKTYLDYLATVISGMAKLVSRAASHLGLDSIVKKLKPLTTLTGDALYKGLSSGLSKSGSVISNWLGSVGKAVVSGTKTVASGVKDAVSYSFSGLKDIGSAAVAKLKQLKEHFLGHKGTVKAAPSKQPLQVGLADQNVGDFTSLQNVGPNSLGVQPFWTMPKIQTQDIEKLKNELLQTNDAFKLIHDSAQTLSQDLTTGIMNMANGVKGAFKNMVTSMLQDLERLAMNKLFSKLLDIGLNALAGVFGGGASLPDASAGSGFISGLQNGGVIGTGVGTQVGGFALQAAPTAAPVNAPMNFNITVHNDGSTQSQGATHDKLATAIHASVLKTIQDEQRPGGSLYRGATA